MNNTSSLDDLLPETISPDLSLEFRIVKISIYVLIFILAIIGNGLVIAVILHDNKMRSSSHILVLNLAICDVITPTISLPFDLAFEELHYHWPFGALMCKILWPAQTLTTTCSALILTAICIDRYRALVHPFKVRWAGKFGFMILAIYILSLALVIPYAFVLRQEKEGDTLACTEKWPRPQKNYKHAYTMLLCLIQYFIPLIFMITFYSITLKSLFNNNKSLPGMMGEDENASCGSQEAERINALREIRKEQHFKVTKMFIFVVIVFAISMFPNQVFWLWVDYGNLAGNKYFSMASIICRIFTYSNSVLNPFIYGLYSRDFRKGYRKAGKRLSISHRKHFSTTSGKKELMKGKQGSAIGGLRHDTPKLNGLLPQQKHKVVKFPDDTRDKSKEPCKDLSLLNNDHNEHDGADNTNFKHWKNDNKISEHTSVEELDSLKETSC